MANLLEGSDWVAGIYQLETDDPVLGGEEGIDNLQAKQLASRTQFLKNALEERITTDDALGLIEPKAPWSVLDQVIVAGGLVPDHEVSTQVLDAINNLVKGPSDKIVRVASTAAINLAAPGANIDGTAMVAGDTFLEKDNATLANRGVYVWNGAAVPATRDPSADNGAELFGGMIIRVKEGTLNADTNWQVTNDGVVTIGVTGLTFQQLNAMPDATTTVKGKVLLAQSSGFTGLGNATDVPPVAAIIAGLLGAGGNSANDYISIPYRDKTDGTLKKLIVQWGASSISAGANVPQAFTLPIAFPTAALRSVASSASAASYAGSTNLTTTQITLFASNNTAGVTWFAIGY